MNKILIFSTIILSALIMGADSKYFNISDTKILKGMEGDNSLPVIDYNKIRKGVSRFSFFPIYFYLSSDGCNTPLEKISKENTLDVEICTGFSVIDDFHHMRFELITPDNAVYQSINIFVDKAESPPRNIKYNDEYTPYSIKRPILFKGVNFIKGSFPVAGSSIQTQNLTGRWRINLFIDDSPEISGSVFFDME
ncbi:MAG: hypothetical protein N3B13_07670 [Deltaproteobacteria bacterium]|nr:hypothetical protein [Deltaproteobacteria bacterium]